MQVKRVIKSGAGLAAVAAAPLVRQTAGRPGASLPTIA